MIANQSDSNAREYGAVIYLTGDGHVRIGDLVRGETVAEALADGRDAPRTVIPIPDTHGGVVLGWVHNHPDIGYDNHEYYLNKMPSDNDWNSFLSASNRNDFATSAILSQYIIGPDGVLREYNMRDGKPISPSGENIYST